MGQYTMAQHTRSTPPSRYIQVPTTHCIHRDTLLNVYTKAHHSVNILRPNHIIYTYRCPPLTVYRDTSLNVYTEAHHSVNILRPNHFIYTKRGTPLTNI